MDSISTIAKVVRFYYRHVINMNPEHTESGIPGSTGMDWLI